MYKRTKDYSNTRSQEVEDKIAAIKAKLKEMFPDLYKNSNEFKKKAFFVAFGNPKIDGIESLLDNESIKSDLEAVASGMNPQSPLPIAKPIYGLPYNSKPKNDTEFAGKIQDTCVVDLNYLMKSVQQDVTRLSTVAKSEKLIVPPKEAAAMTGQQAYNPEKPMPTGWKPMKPVVPGTINPIPESSPWAKSNPLPPIPASMAPPEAMPNPMNIQQSLIDDVTKAAMERRKRLAEGEDKLKEFASKN